MGILYKTLDMESGGGRYQLVLHDSGGPQVLASGPAMEVRSASFPSCGLELTGAPHFAHRLPWATRGGRFVVARSEAYELDLFEGARSVLRVVRDVPGREITRARALAELEDYRIGDCRVPPAEALRGFGYVGKLSAVADMRISPSGEFWVLRGKLKGEQQKVDIFRPDGTYVGTTIESPFPAVFMSDDRIVAISLDALGVPILTAYKIVRGRIP